MSLPFFSNQVIWSIILYECNNVYQNKQKLIKAKQVAKILIRFCKNNKIYTMKVGLHASMQSIAHGQIGN